MKAECAIHSFGAFVPEQVVTNDDIAKLVDTSDEWIIERTGIRKRRMIDQKDNLSDLGLRAALLALDSINLPATSLTHVVASTCTPDSLAPSVACIIAGSLTQNPLMAFDIGAACTGFIYGLYVCRAMLVADPSSKILFVCAEALTRRLNWQDRSTCVLFGDGAVASVLSADSANAICSVIDVICKSDGSQKDLIVVGGGTSCQYEIQDSVDECFFLSMQGRETYKFAVRHMVSVCNEILGRNNLTMDNIDLFIPHQANLRIIEAIGARLGISQNKVFTNVSEYGNTSAASIPLAITEARAQGRIEKGAKVLISAFGAGLTWGAALLQF